MRIHDLLDESVVKVGLESVDKEECFEEMVELLVRGERITDRSGALTAILLREGQCTTGIGRGIAVPHGKHPSITGLVAALGVSLSGIEFDAVDTEPVHLVFMLLARNDDPGPHIQALAEISRLLLVPGFYRKIIEAGTAGEILEIINAEE
ncbi:MAG: PTS sugar transporter subunit IIA [Kiritimatiellales bacterium]|jgi:mannitol/fructose-specific phosphotransferase system IIA component (Ntr-type)